MALSEGVLYVVAPRYTGDRTVDNLYAIDAATATRQWSTNVDALAEYAPTVTAETLYVARSSGSLVALDRGTGDLLWEVDTPEYVDGPVAANDDVAVLVVDSGSGSTVVCVDRTSRGVRWTREMDATVETPALTDGSVIVPGDPVRALDTETASVHWRADDAGMTTPAVRDGLAVLDTTGGIAAYDVTSGRRRWTFDTNWGVGTPALTDALALSTTSSAAHRWTLRALDREDGSERWSKELTSELPTPPVVANETVYIASHAGTVWAFDLSSGERLWTASVATLQETDLAVGDGALYVPTGNRVVCFRDSQ